MVKLNCTEEDYPKFESLHSCIKCKEVRDPFIGCPCKYDEEIHSLESLASRAGSEDHLIKPVKLPVRSQHDAWVLKEQKGPDYNFCDGCHEVLPKSELKYLGDEHNVYLVVCNDCY